MTLTRRKLVALGAGVLPAATAGCLRPSGDDATTAAEIERELGDLDRPETMIGTVETTTYFDQLEAQVREETTLDGRDVYLVRFEPPPDETVERSISVLVGNTEFVIPLETEERETTELQETVERIDVWFDRETLFPVKQVVETDAVDYDAIYTSLSRNEPVADDPFAFDPPDDALVEEHVFPYFDRYNALEDAKADAGVAMAEPTRLPDRFARATAAVADYPYADDLREVSVRYAGDESVGESIRVGVCNGPRPFDVDGEAVTVTGASGTVAESDLGTTVKWPCGERTYFVFATASVDRETVLSVAESVDDCDYSSR